MAAPELAPDHGAASGTVLGDESARRPRRNRSSADRDGETEEEKHVAATNKYECRFCLMKFEKSQALGGHMNRHRQEREKEQYEHAQQLVSSMAQQQMPRNWSSLATAATEMTQSPSGPGGAISRLSSQLTGVTRQFPPPISFASYRGPAPTSGSNPSSPSSNYYLPSNSTSCNNLQNLHWSVDGFSTAATPRSAPQTGNFQAVETTSTSLQASGVPSEFIASMLRATATNNDTTLVSSSTPTSTAQGPYDLYQSFYGGM